jgi:predicted transcriptional regulator
MFEENLSFKTTTDLLTRLKFLGLIEETQSSDKYVTTTRGIEYMRRWAHLQEIIDPNQPSENRLVQGFNRILSAS